MLSPTASCLICFQAVLKTVIHDLLSAWQYYTEDRLARSPMTVNSKLESAWKYHNATNHSYASVHNNLHFLDWDNRPLPFKAYTALEPLALPREARQTGVAALSAIAESIRTDSSAIPDLEALAQLLYLTAGITRHRKHPGGDIHFRAAACTGALYEIELYVVCGNLVYLEAGVYHFSPAEFALRRLRAGYYRIFFFNDTATTAIYTLSLHDAF